MSHPRVYSDMRALMVVVALLLAGCAQNASAPPAQIDPGAVQIDPVRATPDKVAAADAEFGAALLDHLGTGNLVYSPYSIATALQMTLLGARGDTAAEMYQTLRLTKLSPSELASTAAVLRRSLPKQLSVSNALWPDQSLPIEPGYARAVEQGFGPKTTRLDFAGDPDAARQTINAAIAEATHDKIPELLQKGTIDASTIMVLTNAIYLKAQWALPFDKDQTRVGTFTRDDGTTVSTPMMQQNNFSYGYRDGDGYQLIQLPYKKTSLAMSIVLPDGPLSKLGDYDLTGATPTLMRLTMPKFKFRTQVDLTSVLQAMGMRTAFSADADFSGMTPVDTAVDAVIHEAMIDVDEKGTEAAAATAVVMGVSAQPKPQRDVTIDRPFLFAITDTKTGTPLFLGRVLDPSQG